MTATLKSKQTSITHGHLLPVASLVTPVIFHTHYLSVNPDPQYTDYFSYRRLNQTTMAVTLSRDGLTASVGRQWITILTNQRTRIPLMPLNIVGR
jgi:hypothetical protein